MKRVHIKEPKFKNATQLCIFDVQPISAPIFKAPCPLPCQIEKNYFWCIKCSEDDGPWHRNAFRNQLVTKHGISICDACYKERYPVREMKCGSCPKIIKGTRGNAPVPTCRKCRKERRERLNQQPQSRGKRK